MPRPDAQERTMRRRALAERLAAGPPLVLDGALGTELERRGADAGLPLWSARSLVEDPALVARIHAEYAAAGAEVLTADTFRTQARSLAHGGLAERARELTALAVRLAHEAARPAGGQAARPADRQAARPVDQQAARPTSGQAAERWVAGSAPPLEDCYRPDRVPEAAALAREHGAHARNLVDAGADLVLVETMNTAREAVAAVRAAHEAGAPAWVSFVCDGTGRLLSGEPLAEALAAVAPLGPAAVGVNCLPPRAVAPCLPALAAAGTPFFVYANLGAPTEDGGSARSDELAPDAFAARAADWLRAGAAAVGGCCGTTPAHVAAIRALRDRLRARTVTAR